jgi:hypothetical protein
MDSRVNAPRDVSQHKDLEYNETTSVMNEEEIGTGFNHSGTRISGNGCPTFETNGLANPSGQELAEPPMPVSQQSLA